MTAAVRALKLAEVEIRCWDLDPTATYTESVRAAAAEALRCLDEAERRIRAARKVLRKQTAVADAQRSSTPEGDSG